MQSSEDVEWLPRTHKKLSHVHHQVENIYLAAVTFSTPVFIPEKGIGLQLMRRDGRSIRVTMVSTVWTRMIVSQGKRNFWMMIPPSMVPTMPAGSKTKPESRVCFVINCSKQMNKQINNFPQDCPFGLHWFTFEIPVLKLAKEETENRKTTDVSPKTIPDTCGGMFSRFSNTFGPNALKPMMTNISHAQKMQVRM